MADEFYQTDDTVYVTFGTYEGDTEKAATVPSANETMICNGGRNIIFVSATQGKGALGQPVMPGTYLIVENATTMYVTTTEGPSNCYLVPGTVTTPA